MSAGTGLVELLRDDQETPKPEKQRNCRREGRQHPELGEDGRCTACGALPHRKDYTEEEVRAALTAFAICSGHKDKAAELAKSQGFEIPSSTIWYWAKDSRVEEYEKIRREIAPQLQTQMADVQQALAQSAAELEAQTVERLRERLNQGDVEDKDLTNILKNAAISQGIHIEKAQLLNDRPTQIVKKSADEILRKLESKGLSFIDGSAEEMPDEELESAHG